MIAFYHPTLNLEARVRLAIYKHFVKRGRAPTAEETASALDVTFAEAKAAYRHLHEQHMIVLQDGKLDILMANPFSAEPTPYYVEVGDHAYWGNCIWDALGILAMLNRDGQVMTSCACCKDAMTLTVEGGRLIHPDGVIHFSVPARHWWDDIKFT